jgi:hypothetical protein
MGTLRIVAADTGDDWYAEAKDGRILPRRGSAQPDPDPDGGAADSAQPACTVSGPASGLYLFLWNRRDPAQADVTISGDPAPLTLWKSSVRVRWG